MNFFMRSDEDNDRNTASGTPGYPSQSTVTETRSGNKSRNSTRNRLHSSCEPKYQIRAESGLGGTKPLICPTNKITPICSPTTAAI